MTDDLVKALERLVNHVIDHFRHLLTTYLDAVKSIDRQSQAHARSLPPGSGVVVAVGTAAGVAEGASNVLNRTSGVVDERITEQVVVENVVYVEETETVVVTRPEEEPMPVAAVASDATTGVAVHTGKPVNQSAPAASSSESVGQVSRHEDHHQVRVAGVSAVTGPQHGVSGGHHGGKRPGVSSASGSAKAEHVGGLHGHKDDHEHGRPRVSSAEGNGTVDSGETPGSERHTSDGQAPSVPEHE
jgi:hypothetical protein